MIVIVLLFMLTIAFWGCLVRRDLRHSVMFAMPIAVIIGTYIWLCTLLPVRWGLKRLPLVELVQVRDVSAKDCTDMKCSHPKHDGVMELATDKKLDDCEIILEGSCARNLSFNDFMNNDSLAILTSYEVVLVGKINDKFRYKAFFITKQSAGNMPCDSIYCKVFMIRMFAPIYETNEFVVPYSRLFRMKK